MLGMAQRLVGAAASSTKTFTTSIITSFCTSTRRTWASTVKLHGQHPSDRPDRSARVSTSNSYPTAWPYSGPRSRSTFYLGVASFFTSASPIKFCALFIIWLLFTTACSGRSFSRCSTFEVLPSGYVSWYPLVPKPRPVSSWGVGTPTPTQTQISGSHILRFLANRTQSGPANQPSVAATMSSSQARNGERMIPQDFIARIRYVNALPPPPVPPKLLEIPNTGLSSGQYTNPGFASRLARDQPLNIEADAELGMPLDLVGMPGIFDGDESAIQAPAQQPPVHPHDRALLRPLATLGKPKLAETHVSFLRRTEYIASTTPKAASSVFIKPNTASPASSQALRRPEKRKAVFQEPDKGSPAYIKRKIDKSFEIAAAHRKDLTRVRHPSNSRLRCTDAFPILPDLDAFPDSGAYVTVKFVHNPVPSSNTYDTRLLSGVFKPITRSDEAEEALKAAMDAHELDPENNPRPNTFMNYEFYLPSDSTTAKNFRRRFDVDDPEHDDDALYGKGGDHFQFDRVRAYETTEEKELDHESKFSDELVLAFNEDEHLRERAVYYYPIMQRSVIRPQRTKNIARTMGGAPPDEDEFTVDQLDITVSEPDDYLKKHMAKFKEHPYGFEESEPGDAPGGVRTPVSDAGSDKDADGEEAD